MLEQRIGFIGAGNMARALVKGLLAARVAQASSIVVSDRDPAQVTRLTDEFGVGAKQDNRAVLGACDCLVLAVKPQSMAAVLGEISSLVTDQHLIVSIAAGVEMSTITRTLPSSARVVRAMPNMPALVQAGATAIALGSNCSADDTALAQALFGAVGKTVVVSESLMNAVTGLSGSGPAYIMLVIEGLADGGVQMGLPRDVALLLATQTVLGAATLLAESGEHPAQLKDRVSSPGGTTIAGVAALEAASLRSAMMQAVRAATLRAEELGQLSRNKNQ